MTERNQNSTEPAYPTNFEGYPESFGLTKRELFAAMAMQGILSANDFQGNDGQLVKTAVTFADKLLEELAK